jgi:ABC-type antimicrobial peptide transport system permease subunit
MNLRLAPLRRTLRTAVRQPGVTIPALRTLALGIGINAALGSVVAAALLRPAPYSQPEWLVDVQAWNQERGRRQSLTPADFLAWREATSAFEHLGAFQASGTVDLTGEGAGAGRDLVGLATAVLVLLTTAALASLLPALRAARVDPNTVLRQ